MSRLTAQVVLPAGAVLATALLAGCGGSGGLDTDAAGSGSSARASASASPTDTSTSSAPPTATPSTSTSADASAAAESAVAADMRSYLTGLTKGLRIRNARVVDLIQYSTPPRQAIDRSHIQELRQRGVVLRGSPRSWVGDVNVVGNRASLHLCEKDDSSWYEYSSSGKQVGTRLDRWDPLEVRMLKRDGRWQVNLIVPAKKSVCKAAS